MRVRPRRVRGKRRSAGGATRAYPLKSSVSFLLLGQPTMYLVFGRHFDRRRHRLYSQVTSHGILAIADSNRKQRLRSLGSCFSGGKRSKEERAGAERQPHVDAICFSFFISNEQLSCTRCSSCQHCGFVQLISCGSVLSATLLTAPFPAV